MAKNRIHSVLTTLPALMLMIGLYVWYSGEQEQLEGPILLAEAVSLEGEFNGLSEVRSGGQGQHFLWIDTEQRLRAGRISAEEAYALKALAEPLSRGQSLTLRLAPTVSGSKTLWVIEVTRDDEVLLAR